ncbi:MAG: hypothetical protein EP349_04300 [Alphaproteobacteria bacterium]|nr:MAG: hypothetical protein EP349_04300 [Alphaproteobacteria bacterium]
MRKSVKISALLTALGISTALLLHPATSHAQSGGIQTPTMVDLDQKRAAAAQKRAAMKAQLDADQANLEKIAGAKPGGSNMKKKSGSFDLAARREKNATKRKARLESMSKRRKNLVTYGSSDYAAYGYSRPRTAPGYYEDSLIALEEFDKKYPSHY